jgi:hypothetical protein
VDKKTVLYVYNLPNTKYNFDEVGKLASNLKYIFVAIPLKDRNTVLVNGVQQLHLRRLAIGFLTPEQMAILHLAVKEKTQKDGFNALATKISDYYQMDTTYVRNNENDIIVILHISGNKEIDLLTIYRYFPLQIPIPILP